MQPLCLSRALSVVAHLPGAGTHEKCGYRCAWPVLLAETTQETTTTQPWCSDFNDHDTMKTSQTSLPTEAPSASPFTAHPAAHRHPSRQPPPPGGESYLEVDRLAHRAEVRRQVRRVGDERAVGAEQSAAEIEALLDVHTAGMCVRGKRFKQQL
eukprot:360341-Chlamydomonas_euryale.AAC.16